MTSTSTQAVDTRSRILDAALEVFSEHGFEGSTLQQVADLLGVTKAALYYHFPSKDDILVALVTPAMADLDALLDSHAGTRDTPARRREFLAGYLDYLLAHRRLMAYISRDLATLAHPAITASRAERRARMEAMLAGDDLDFADQIRVAMAFGGLQSAIAQNPDAETAALREALLAATATLLRPRRAAPPAASA
ncbi:MAG TPA: helix-turn-helix domain-containing protein [Solirubrobacteraceae bacterium]